MILTRLYFPIIFENSKFPPPKKEIVSQKKPKKVMIAIQYVNPCDTETEKKRECETIRMLKKAFLRNHYHEIDRNWDEIDLTFKFFISEREYRIVFNNRF